MEQGKIGMALAAALYLSIGLGADAAPPGEHRAVPTPAPRASRYGDYGDDSKRALFRPETVSLYFWLLAKNPSLLEPHPYPTDSLRFEKALMGLREGGPGFFDQRRVASDAKKLLEHGVSGLRGEQLMAAFEALRDVDRVLHATLPARVRSRDDFTHQSSYLILSTRLVKGHYTERGQLLLDHIESKAQRRELIFRLRNEMPNAPTHFSDEWYKRRYFQVRDELVDRLVDIRFGFD